MLITYKTNIHSPDHLGFTAQYEVRTLVHDCDITLHLHPVVNLLLIIWKKNEAHRAKNSWKISWMGLKLLHIFSSLTPIFRSTNWPCSRVTRRCAGESWTWRRASWSPQTFPRTINPTRSVSGESGTVWGYQKSDSSTDWFDTFVTIGLNQIERLRSDIPR